jgi:hypothetical protein
MNEIQFQDSSGVIYRVNPKTGEEKMGRDIPGDAERVLKQGNGWAPQGQTYIQWSTGGDQSTTSSGQEDPQYDANADPEQELLDAQATLDSKNNVNEGSSSAYGPNDMYDSNKPIKIDVPGKIIQGAEGRPISVNSVTSVPQGELNALGYYLSPGLNMKKLAEDAAEAMYEGSPSIQQIDAVYSDAVRIAAVKDITVQQALRELTLIGLSGVKKGSSGSGGSGGPFRSVSKTITQTDEVEAERILNSALSTYLGRRADSDEVAEFVKKLNKLEKFNPTVTKTTGVRSGNNTTQQATQTGGFDSTGFAERWARSREGAAEYQAATTYMDAFQSVIDGMEY